jgi:hypothetical protein
MRSVSSSASETLASRLAALGSAFQTGRGQLRPLLRRTRSTTRL